MLGLSSDQWVILAVGGCVAAACALVGSFLVLRRVALLGDAISHAVLPGIAIAFIFTGSRSTVPMLIGAGALGVLTVFLVEVLKRTRLMHEDASIGVVFPALFSIGVILVARYAGQVDLDLDCVLYGEIAYAPLDTLVIGGSSYGPKPLWVSGAILLLDLAMVVVLYKELKLSSFDPELAAALGISPAVVHYLLMSSVSVTVVGSFESVGAILVVAMLIVPPATAYLLTNSLAVMLVLSALIGIASSTLGYFAAHWLDCSIAGAMATVAGLLFIVTLLLSPRYGLLSRGVGRLLLGARLRQQLVLLHLSEEGAGVRLDRLGQRFGWPTGRLRRTVARLQRDGLVARRDDGWRLTSRGAAALASAGTTPLAHGR